MNTLIDEIHRKRAQLTAECDSQRNDISLRLLQFRQSFSNIDKGMQIFGFIAHHPLATLVTGIILNRLPLNRTLQSIISLKALWTGILKLKNWAKRT